MFTKVYFIALWETTYHFPRTPHRGTSWFFFVLLYWRLNNIKGGFTSEKRVSLRSLRFSVSKWVLFHAPESLPWNNVTKAIHRSNLVVPLCHLRSRGLMKPQDVSKHHLNTPCCLLLKLCRESGRRISKPLWDDSTWEQIKSPWKSLHLQSAPGEHGGAAGWGAVPPMAANCLLVPQDSPSRAAQPERRQRATMLLTWGLLLTLQTQGKLCYFYAALAIGVWAK